MINSEIAKIFQEIGEYLEMKEEPFRPKAYAKAARVIEELEEDVTKIYERGGLRQLTEIPGVGESIADKIEEYIKTGKIKYFEELKKKAPVDVSSLSAVEGLGPKKIKTLYNKLNVRSLEDLEKAAEEGKIRKLAGFGAKTEENIIKGIQFLKQSGGRFTLGATYVLAGEIRERIKKLNGVSTVDIAGSARRMKETIGDIDLLAVIESIKDAELAMDYFVSMPEVINVYSKGPTRSSVRIKEGIDVDLRILPKESYGAGLIYFTGSKDHNIELRKIAIKKGLKLNEYGLFKGKTRVAGKTEAEVYEHLGLKLIAPELRENTGEIIAAEEDRLPHLVEEKDIMGDLQIQTNWTDGENSIMDYAETAIKRGLKYILITDHSKRLAMANGLDERRLKEQGKEIDKINKILADKGSDFKILKGLECDILKDGELDLSDDALSELDMVGAAVHSYFNLPIVSQTERLLKAMENRNVDIIFHPTARVINQRKAIDLDMEALTEAALKTGTILEIDAYPDRLDLKDEYIRRCVERGVKLAIDSDAHSVKHMTYLKFGVAQARRGWASKKNIVNTLPVNELMEKIKT
ncbi:MAG: DNA polymerase/3'-5' exonuclease PolX [Parcubacteria group bacterium]